MESGFPSFPDAANAWQVNPAGSTMATDTELDRKSLGREL